MTVDNRDTQLLSESKVYVLNGLAARLQSLLHRHKYPSFRETC
jgi:hypothetical protein